MTLPLIAVDIGNSTTKLAMFAGVRLAPLPEPLWTHTLVAGESNAELLGKLPEFACWRVASVHREQQRQFARWIAEDRPGDRYHCLTHDDLPIEIRVDSPDRVGLDRLAAAVGANLLRDPGRPAVVVDAGSAVTVDLVTAEGAFAGGVILPGFRMSARALASADLLPEVLYQTSSEPPPVLGKNTEAAIRSGLFWGTVGAVREIIAGYAASHPHPQVFVTGGDLARLAPLMSNEAQFVPHLVLAGIVAGA